MLVGALALLLIGVQTQLKIFVQSPGVLADPYKPPPPPLPFFKLWFSREGWKRIREGIMDSVSGPGAPTSLPSLDLGPHVNLTASKAQTSPQSGDASWCLWC